MRSLLRHLGRGKEILVSFAGRLPPELGAVLEAVGARTVQQHRIHPEEALHAVAPGAGRLAVWALTAAAALALQQDVAGPAVVKIEVHQGLTALIDALPGAAASPGNLNQRLGLEPRALEAAIDAMTLEIVAAVLDEPAPETGFSARTGA
jgi:hypothetical protein